MGHPKEEPKNDPEKAPKLDAILPDDLPPAAAELVGDIDNYQKRMEHEWEKAKNTYEDKINKIMSEFLEDKSFKAAFSAEPRPAETPPARPSPHGGDRLSELMSEIDRELKAAASKNKRVSFGTQTIAEPMQLAWSGMRRFNWRDPRKIILAAAVAAAAVVAAYLHFFFVQVTPLPYTHTLGPILTKEHVYIMDWFRKALFVHANDRSLTLKSVEPVSNNLATGMAMSEKTLWTLDSLDHKILMHTVTPEHQITGSVSTPEARPSGLFFDGMDLWSADQDGKQLYRHRGNDIEEIRDSFPLPELTVTAIALKNGRLWILDGKSRLANVYRLQKPLLLLGSFDLDPFVNGAMPTGLAFEGNRIYLTTENPSTLTRIPMSRLKKSKTETF